MGSRVAEGHGLLIAELHVVNMLGNFGEMTMGALAERTLISPANTTRTVKKLEAKGYVARKRSQRSNREVNVRLTAKGTRLFDKAFPAVNKAAAELFDGALTPRQQEEAHRLLSQLTENDD